MKREKISFHRLSIRRDSVPFDRRFCAMAPCERKADVIFGARPACLRCAERSRAVVEQSRLPSLALAVRP